MFVNNVFSESLLILNGGTQKRVRGCVYLSGQGVLYPNQCTREEMASYPSSGRVRLQKDWCFCNVWYSDVNWKNVCWMLQSETFFIPSQMDLKTQHLMTHFRKHTHPLWKPLRKKLWRKWTYRKIGGPVRATGTEMPQRLCLTVRLCLTTEATVLQILKVFIME